MLVQLLETASLKPLSIHCHTQLLGELLLDRHNFTVMTKYISRAENLKLMMNMLRDNSRNIQFEAFHVFKVCFCKHPDYAVFLLYGAAQNYLE